MKSNTLLAGAAIAGIFAGAAMKASASTSTPSKAAGIVDAEKKGESHDCAGKNSCKGKGGCKSGDGGCAGKNSCKGKGGCAMKDGKPAHK
jgi:hypothetical protein